MTRAAGDFVTVRVCADTIELELARSMLESEGIECIARDETSASASAMDGALFEPILMVRQRDHEQARRLLDGIDEARKHPEDVHILCDSRSQRSELKDLDNLVVDLEDLSFCSIGRGAPRDAVEGILGAPAVYGDQRVELRYSDLGAVVYIDEQGGVAGFHLVVIPSPEFPDLDPYPGFFEPGSRLQAPSREELLRRFGVPAERAREHGVEEIVWKLQTGTITVQLVASSRLGSISVEFE